MFITAIQQASYQRRSLGTLKKKVLSMEAEWNEVDTFFENRLNELANAIQKLQDEMTAYVTDMKSESGHF